MGRPAKFSREKALSSAQQVFLSKGYEAASLDDLLTAMNIGRQSLYNSFGDKRHLFLEAIKLEVKEDLEELHTFFNSHQPIKKQVLSWLSHLNQLKTSEKRKGCLILNSAMELAGHDKEIADIVNHSRQAQETLFKTAFERAKANNELPVQFDCLHTAQYFVVAFAGMILIAKSNPKSPALAAMAQKLAECVA